MDFIRRFTRQISFKATTPAVGTEFQVKLKQYTLKDVAQHCTYDSCWMVIYDKVYDFTEFIEYHPGGYEIMLEYGGTDATNAFMEKPHTIEAIDMLDKYIIGELVIEDRMFKK